MCIFFLMYFNIRNGGLLFEIDKNKTGAVTTVEDPEWNTER